MKINARQNAIVARRKARKAFFGHTPIDGKLRKGNVPFHSEKAVVKWDEPGLGRVLAYKYPAFNLDAELAAYSDEVPLVDPVAEREAYERATVVPCPSCAEAQVAKGYIIVCQWCGGENRGWLSTRAPRKLSLYKLRRKYESLGYDILALEDMEDLPGFLRDKIETAKKAAALLGE